MLFQHGLGIKQIQVRRPASLPQIDDSLSFWGMVRQSWNSRLTRTLILCLRFASQKRSESSQANPCCGATEQLPPRYPGQVFREDWFQDTYSRVKDSSRL